MANNPHRGNPGITFSEAAIVRRALSEYLAGEYEGDRNVGESALSKLDVKRGTVLVPFSKSEMLVLLEAISNGAEGVLQPSSGCRPDQKKAFAEAANRLLDAAKSGAPRY